MTCEFQCFVNQNLVCEGVLKGVALPPEQPVGESGQPAGELPATDAE